MSAAVRIIASVPEFFGHAGDAAVRDRAGFGCYCANCRRAVSAPFGYEGTLIWCLYCGVEAGYVPAVDSPWGHRFTFGVTREECIEDRLALDRGEHEATAEARARREGRVLDILSFGAHP